MELLDSHGTVPPEITRRLRPPQTCGTQLFGREADLASVRRLLTRDGVRLLTLTGAGGTGKTRLACAVAAMVELDQGLPACFVDLSTVDDPSLVQASIAQSVGIQESGSEPVGTILLEVLRERPLLLVLDNFE